MSSIKYGYKNYNCAGNHIAISVEYWRDSFFSVFDNVTLDDFIGKIQEDGTVFWIKNNGSMVPEGMEKYLNRVHRHVQMKK